MHGIKITMTISVKIIRLPADIRTRNKSLALSLDTPSWMSVVLTLPGTKFYFIDQCTLFGLTQPSIEMYRRRYARQ
jgi:hypothetical protein